MEILLGIIVIVAIIFYLNNNSNKEKSQKLYTAYRQALAAKNKEAGRAYYAFKRKDGRLTIYDEQAITNDLAAYTQPDSAPPSY